MLVYHTDPGHGWLQISPDMLKDVGIEHSISRYSYEGYGCIFLEEDCDMPKFFNAYYSKYGVIPSYTEENYNEDCFIRELEPYFC